MLSCLVAFAVNAQVFVENFETATVGGDLEGYNNWYVSLKSADALGVSPKIALGSLSFTGYAGSGVGNVAVLDSVVGTTSETQRISTKIVAFGTDTLHAVVGEKIYAAFLINVSNHSYHSYRDFFTFEGSKTGSMTRGRIFAKIDAAGSELTFAITKNSSSTSNYVESSSISGLTLTTGTANLLVFVYEAVDGDNNDKQTLYINPDLSKSEAEQTNKLETIDVQSDYSEPSNIGINLRQRGVGAQIGGIRVGKSWDAVLTGDGTGVKTITSSPIRILGKSIITENEGTLSIYNFSGSLLVNAPTNGRYDTSLKKGLYLARFTDITGNTYSRKIELF